MTIVRKLGFLESVARCCKVHESGGGLTRIETEELKFPIFPLKECHTTKTIEKNVNTVDLFVYRLEVKKTEKD